MNSSVPKQPVATSDSCSNSHWLLAVGLGSAIGNGCRPGFGLGSAYVRPTFGLGSAWVRPPFGLGLTILHLPFIHDKPGA